MKTEKWGLYNYAVNMIIGGILELYLVFIWKEGGKENEIIQIGVILIGFYIVAAVMSVIEYIRYMYTIKIQTIRYSEIITPIEVKEDKIFPKILKIINMAATIIITITLIIETTTTKKVYIITIVYIIIIITYIEDQNITQLTLKTFKITYYKNKKIKKITLHARNNIQKNKKIFLNHIPERIPYAAPIYKTDRSPPSIIDQ